ncbi:MAG: hypothetical protein KAI79_20735, partial [Bacteroidales bacterium]|nr:hypothetical protein [Bacteroidales bacterium]
MTLKQDIGNNKLIASLVLLIISFFSLLGYLIGERIIMTQAQNDASMLASSSGDFLISEISRFELLPSMVQMCSCVKNLLEEPDNTDIRDKTNLKLEEIVSLSDAQVVYLLDINGHTLASSNWKSKQSFVGNNYSIRPYFIDAIDNKTGRYIALGLTSKKLGYYLAKPIMSNNSIQGVLVVKIGMDILQEKLQQQFEQREEEVIISDKNDIIFISTKTDWLFHSLKTLSNNELNHVKTHQTYADIAIKPLELTDHKFLNRYARILTSDKKHYILYINTLHNIQLNVNIVVPLDKYYYTRNLSLFLGIILGLFISTFLLFLYIRDTYQKNIVNNAITDPLTGLYTRLYLQEFAPKLFLLHQRDR